MELGRASRPAERLVLRAFMGHYLLHRNKLPSFHAADEFCRQERGVAFSLLLIAFLPYARAGTRSSSRPPVPPASSTSSEWTQRALGVSYMPDVGDRSLCAHILTRLTTKP